MFSLACECEYVCVCVCVRYLAPHFLVAINGAGVLGRDARVPLAVLHLQTSLDALHGSDEDEHDGAGQAAGLHHFGEARSLGAVLLDVRHQRGVDAKLRGTHETLADQGTQRALIQSEYLDHQGRRTREMLRRTAACWRELERDVRVPRAAL